VIAIQTEEEQASFGTAKAKDPDDGERSRRRSGRLATSGSFGSSREMPPGRREYHDSLTACRCVVLLEATTSLARSSADNTTTDRGEGGRHADRVPQVQEEEGVLARDESTQPSPGAEPADPQPLSDV
jgi:hypothetical protein